MKASAAAPGVGDGGWGKSVEEAQEDLAAEVKLFHAKLRAELRQSTWRRHRSVVSFPFFRPLFIRSRQISRGRMAGACSGQESASLVLVRNATTGHGALGKAKGREQGGVVRGRLPRVLHLPPRATAAEGPEEEGSRDAYLRLHLPPSCLSRGGEVRAERPSMETAGRGQLLQPLQRVG